MPSDSPRIVLDTNVILRGMLSAGSAAGRLLQAAQDRDFVILISRPVLSEYRAVLTDEETIERFPALTPRIVDVTLLRLRYLGDYLRELNVVFRYPRDPRDEKFIELAIAGRATHILSFDADLLSLSSGRTDAARRFRQRLPRIAVMRPGDYWRSSFD